MFFIQIQFNGLGAGCDFETFTYTQKFDGSWDLEDAYKSTLKGMRKKAIGLGLDVDDLWVQHIETSRNVGNARKGFGVELMYDRHITPTRTLEMQRLWHWFRKSPSLTRMDVCMGIMKDGYFTSWQFEKFEAMALDLING